MNSYISWGISNSELSNKITNEQFIFINAIGEFIGMFIFIFMLVGVICNFTLKASKFYSEKNSGWIVLGISFGLLFGLLLSFGIQHSLFLVIDKSITLEKSQYYISNNLNPVFIINGIFKGVNLSDNYIPIGNGIIYLLFEFLGSLLGAYFAYLAFSAIIKKEKEIKSIRGCFYTSPAIESKIHNYFSEFIATLILTIFIYGISSIFNSDQSILKLIIISIIVGSIGYGLGGITGYALNPFRDLCPRIIYNILLKRNDYNCVEDWKYSLVPIISPIVGSLIGLVVMPGFLY